MTLMHATEKVWIVKYMFGYRVQAGDADPSHGSVVVNYCCGTDTYVIGLVSMMVQLAIRRGYPAATLPQQLVKPIWNDQVCFKDLATMAGCTSEEISSFFHSYPPDRRDARLEA